ncbi:MAG TPA: alkaline phosphatase family protein [Chloroflexia bacterium]|nr:alkaline phosphatase family protein [Chloroflexia bacterium]
MPRVVTAKILFLELVLMFFLSILSTPFQNSMTVAAAANNENCQSFVETGFSVCGSFLDYWQHNGGLAQFGLPVSKVLDEKNPDPPAGDGQLHRVQYFERARFEEHPENQPPYNVLLGLLGSAQFHARYSSIPAPSNRLQGECQAFPVTGFQACGPFLDYWRSNGGLLRQGYPISPVFEERNLPPPMGDGQLHLVQYFERARFEWHPENPRPYQVLLGLIGTELYRTKYVDQSSPATPATKIQTVFLIVMENHNWSSIKGNPSAPYINQTLLPMASHAEQYYNPPKIHPSEPNYLWLEAGTNFGVLNDADPAANHQNTPNHLVSLLEKAHISWKFYQEDISGTKCPLTNQGLYAVRHNPAVYFDDVTANPGYCISHVRPYSELAGDLQANNVARYNFITPNVCNDMHNTVGCASTNSVKNGDTWLSNEVPKILNSKAYQESGLLIITWDEGAPGDGPIGLLVLSPNAKGQNYSNTVHYTHSSTLRTVQEIFGVGPLLGDTANATDLGDLFKTFP